MRAFVTAVIYFGTFISIGLAVRLLVRKRMGDVELPNVWKQAGPSPRKRFLLGAWRNED